jgi:hypothetical protein
LPRTQVKSPSSRCLVCLPYYHAFPVFISSITHILITIFRLSRDAFRWPSTSFIPLLSPIGVRIDKNITQIVFGSLKILHVRAFRRSARAWESIQPHFRTCSNGRDQLLNETEAAMFYRESHGSGSCVSALCVLATTTSESRLDALSHTFPLYNDRVSDPNTFLSLHRNGTVTVTVETTSIST